MRKFYKATKLKHYYQHRLQIESLETRNLLTVSLPNVFGPYLDCTYCGNTTISGGTLTIGGGGLTLDTGPHHAPSGTDKAIAITPDLPYTLKVEDFGFTDPNDTPPDQFQRVRIVTLPTSGNLTNAGSPVMPGQFISEWDIETGNLQYTPDSTTAFPVHAIMTFQVQDSARWNNANLDTSPKSLVFCLGANAAPVAQDDAYVVPAGQMFDEGMTVAQMHVVSHPEDSTSSSTTYDYDQLNYVFTASRNDSNGVTIVGLSRLGDGSVATSPDLFFSAPGGAELTAGVYNNTREAHHDINTPGMTVDLGGAIWSSVSFGHFTINDVKYGPLGEVLKFDADFVQYWATPVYTDYTHFYIKEWIPSTASLSGHIHFEDPAAGRAGILQNDTDADGDPLQAMLVAGPQHGSLSLDSDGGFRYTPNTGFTGFDSFQYKASDVIAQSNVATVMIDVLDFTKAPAGTMSAASVPDGPSYALKVADFGFTDPNETPADTFTRVKISTLPTVGELTLSGISVTTGQFINVTDIAAGNLVLAPATGRPHASFTFQVEDSGSTEAGEANLDPDPKTLTFDVAPVAQDETYTAHQNETFEQFVSFTHLHMVSQMGDPIGGGQTYDYNDVNYNFVPSRNSRNGITFCLNPPPPMPIPGQIVISNGPELDFAAADGDDLAVGTYSDALIFDSTDTTKPGICVSPRGRMYLGSDAFSAQFTINQVEYGPSGEVLKFDATFTQYNGSTTAPLTGRIQYHADSLGAIPLLQNDSDTDGDPFSAVLVAGPQHGTLALMSDGGFSYTPAPGYSGVDTFQYKANDGLLDSNVATVSINVLPFGHAPQGTTSTVSVPSVNSYALKVADFGFTDPNDALADTFTGVKITTLPTGASLLLSDVPVTEGQLISVEDIAAGNLVLTPATGRPHINFTFQVDDSGSTEYGGTNLDPDPKTLTFNSPPVAQDDVYTINENEVLDNALLGNHLRVTSNNTCLSHLVSTIDVDGSGDQCTVTQDGYTLTFTYSNYGGLYYYGGCWVTFAAAGGVQLSPGVYINPKETADADNPGLSFSWLFGSFSNLTGQFTVNEAVYDTEGNILRFDATFSQQDLATGHFRTGRLQYNASTKLGKSLLENDTDADGDPLLVTPLQQTLGGGGLVIGGSGILVNGGGTIVIDGGGLIINPPIFVQVYPQHGNLSLNRDGGFVYTPNHNYYGPDSFRYSTNDGTADSNVATVSINVVQVSQAPLGTTGVIKMVAGVPYVMQPADFGFSDPDDSPADTFTRVEFTTLPTSGTLALDGELVFAGQFIAVDDIAAGKLTFTSEPGTPHPTCTFQVEDSGTINGGATLDPTPKTLTFDFTPIAQDDSFSVNENGTLSLLDFDSHLHMAGEPGDYILGNQSFDFYGSAITASCSTTGDMVDFEINSEGHWWSLHLAAPQGVPLAPGTYSDATRWPFQATDKPGLALYGDGRGSNTLTGQFVVNEIEFASDGTLLSFDGTFEQHSEGWTPAATGRIQYHTPVSNAGGVLANDVDANEEPLTAVLVSRSQHGSLYLQSDGGFRYVPDAYFYGVDSFQYKANDGLADSNVATVTIMVNHVSQAPSGTSAALNISADSPYVLKVEDFGFADPLDSPFDTFTGVVIGVLPASGTLKLDGAAVAAGQFIAIADISAGNLTFTPSVNTAGVPHAVFMFQVEDSGSTDRGGMVLDPVPKSITFNCIPAANDDTYNVFVGDGTADFNGDGTSDVLWQNKSTGLVGSWIVRNGAYSSWSPIASADPAVWKVIGLGDFNGDATSDILWQNKSTGLVGVWFVRNAAYGGWANIANADFSKWKMAGIGDFNGDGTSDILWQNQITGLVGSWIIRNGAYHSWTPIASADPSVWKVAGIGDFNGDKTSDVLWQNQSTGLIGSWIVRNGVYGSWAPIASADLSVWKVTGIGDFNGDGTSDVLWQNQSTGLTGSWIVRNGAYSSWAGFASADPSVWKVAGIRDVNGDKTLDVLWQNQSTGLVGAWVIRNGAYNRWAGIASADPSVWKLIGRNANVALLSAETEMPAPAASVHSLTQNDVQPLVDAAIGRWAAAGLDASTLAKLRQVKLAISDLHGSELAETEGNRITIDANAAGHGWFVDTTPDKDEEFILSPTNQLKTIDPQALDRIDLLSVVEHELGHVAGFDDLDSLAENVMDGILGVGLRRIPS